MSLVPTAHEDGAPFAGRPVGPADGGDSQPGPPGLRGRRVLVLLGIALVITLLVRGFVLQAFYIPSASMDPTLHVGDRVLVSKISYRVGDIRRGDVVVFDGADSFTPEVAPARGLVQRGARWIGSVLGLAPNEHDFVKRVVGLPGDSVVCCTADGRLTVNGVPVTEPYVHPGDRPSAEPFSVVVPAGRLWVMGDHRSDSADSRAHLGDPGGGTVPESKVVGKVIAIYWPLGRVGTPAGAPQLARVPERTGVGGAR